MIRKLTVHAHIEERLFYPAAGLPLPTPRPRAGEHCITSRRGMDAVGLAGMDPADERFTAKVTVLIENVRHHVEEEEQGWFPQVRKAMGRKVVQQPGEEMAVAKATRPRTRSAT